MESRPSALQERLEFPRATEEKRLLIRRRLLERLLVVASLDQIFHRRTRGMIVVRELPKNGDERRSEPIAVERADLVESVDHLSVRGQEDKAGLDEFEGPQAERLARLAIAAHPKRDEFRADEVDDAGVGERRHLHVSIGQVGAVHVQPAHSWAVPEDEPVLPRGPGAGLRQKGGTVDGVVPGFPRFRILGMVARRKLHVDQLRPVGDPGDLAVALFSERDLGSLLGRENEQGERESHQGTYWLRPRYPHGFRCRP